MTALVDASHAANKKTRHSHTGFVIFINCAPIIWYSKRQATVVSSTYLFVVYIAMKTCAEAIKSLRYKLCMFVVPLELGEPTQVFCDNESIVNNSTKVDSRLNKKHSSVAYHYIRCRVSQKYLRYFGYF